MTVGVGGGGRKALNYNINIFYGIEMSVPISIIIFRKQGVSNLIEKYLMLLFNFSKEKSPKLKKRSLIFYIINTFF